MNGNEIVRSTAAYWLAVIDLFSTPLKVAAVPARLSPAQERELQEEVWEMWRTQPAPLREVIFG